MPWGEAVRLTGLLTADPSSTVAAAIHEWETPVSREWLLLADTFDRLTILNVDSKSKPKPYPRPFPDPNTRRRGRTTRSRAEVVLILNAHGHQIGA